ncbi:MAG TPA: dienelactone hydrolase family protein [Candidatus Obscuribacterales bacterium]
MPASTIQITSADKKQFEAYVARPSSTPAPAVIVIQEIFGINPWLRSVADRLAQEGYLAVAPDLFHRQEPGIQLTDKTQAEWDKAFQLYKGFDENKGVEDLIATLETVKRLPECSGKVGSLGFCLGGKLAFLMSTRSSSDANVSFYGVGIEQNINEPVKHPLLLHIAEADEHVPAAAQKQIHDKLDNNKLVTIYVYPGAGHAFGREGSKHEDKPAFDLACKRSLEFLKHHLGLAVKSGR